MMNKQSGWLLGGGLVFLAAALTLPLLLMYTWRSAREEEAPVREPASLVFETRYFSSGERSAVRLDVPYIGQKNVLPTGCELVSAAMLLRYYGYQTSLDDLVDRYLDRAPLVRDGERLYGPHPSEAFVGDPRSTQGYGCYAPVIERMLNRVLTNGRRAVVYEGVSLAQLERTCLDQGRPVLLWVSIDMRETGPGTTWTIRETGQSFTWTKPEHCMVLVGYDDTAYYFNDPYNNNGLVSYPKAVVEARYRAFGSQAVAVEG